VTEGARRTAVLAGRTRFPAVDAVVAEAAGHGRRRDPVQPGSGGPAGNARLTAWAGLLLLAVTCAELVTLLDVTGLIRWHVGVGIVLTALALLKTASTGWRIVRYYAGSATYGSAGAPPLLLRLLGPLVVLATLSVLGTGFALIAIGEQASHQPMFGLLGQRVSPLSLHQLSFIVFAVVAGLHLLARFAPAVLLAGGRAHRGQPRSVVPGRPARASVVTATVLAGAIAVVLVVPSVTGWHHDHGRDDGPDHGPGHRGGSRG
jgi:hypothetical protein